MRKWLAEATDDGRAVLRIGRDGDDIVAEWPGLATLVVPGSDVRTARFQAEEHANPELLAKLRAVTVPALLRHLSGGLTLHASAIRERAAAVAFVGESGAGKSTLAYACCSQDDRVSALLADDALFVDEAGRALPTESEGWLDSAARRALGVTTTAVKAPARPLRVASEPVVLRAVVKLVYGKSFALRRIRGVEAAGILGPSMVRFILDDPDVHRSDMQQLSRLMESVVVLELCRPRGFPHLVETMSVLDRALSW